ncbi:MAG: alpha/beta hydrolase [Aureispira sp.]|nr:alpha/beta hydrolase [Aureispira sp.]
MNSILLLHGALGSQKDFVQLKEILSTDYKVYSLNFSGHGGRTFPRKGFSMAAFVQDILAFMELYQLEQIDVFGYSMGGYVALELAKQEPQKLGKLFTLGTKFDWTPESAAKEAKMLNPDKIEAKIPKFAEALFKTHEPADWKEVMRCTVDMMTGLGNGLALSAADLNNIQHPISINVGSLDNMVSQEESELAAQQLPNGTFNVLEGFKHPINQVDMQQLATRLKAFF